jgi:hypothetical protein
MPANRFFCGWTAARQPVSEAIVGVHHPNGGQMRISYGTLTGVDGSFHEVQWSDGVTAPGSSGSPLFNPQKQVIGQLYGGSSSCANPSGLDEYGRFDRTYTSISQYLGAGGGPATDPYDPVDDTLATATLLAIPLTGAEHGPHSLSKIDAADWFAFDLVAGERYRIFSTGADDVDATLYSDPLGTLVAAADADSGGGQQFSIDFTPDTSGRFSLRVTTSVPLADAEYVLHVQRVDLTKSKAAPAVQKLRRAVLGTTVTLRWKDRSGEAGYLVDVSSDGTDWQRAAELPRNAHVFQGEPGPGIHYYRVGGWNASGAINWRQVSVDVVDVDMLDASDPSDDTPGGATVLPTPNGSTPIHSLSRADAEDWYRIAMTAGRAYVFTTSGSGDTFGELYGGVGGTTLETANNDGGPARNFKVSFRPGRTGTYWIRVTPAFEADVLTYTLHWTERP